MAKQLNALISDYLPAKYQLNSTDDFLHILRALNPTGVLASLDVESLFTNVPVRDTINIICDCIYRNQNLPPLPIPEHVLRELLETCTTGCPFEYADGTLYAQVDGVSMGSPLGVSFANFYMTHLENTVFENQPQLKPQVYCRYIDDCFLIVNSESDLAPVINSFSLNSVLNFTHEVGGSRINFLDVTIEDEGSDHYCTKVYRKPTDPGITSTTEVNV